MRILLAQLGDAAAILRLQKVAYQTEARLYGDDIPPLQQTLAELEREFGHFLILKAVGNGEVVGSVRARRDGGTCHLGRLIVKPELQGRGLGTLLMQQIESRCADAARFELFTGDRSLGNLRLYRRLGYTELRREVVRPGLCLVYLEKLNDQVSR
jgi:GNAT superfamily N-acetyltransferase